jgi:hypothetical protein
MTHGARLQLYSNALILLTQKKLRENIISKNRQLLSRCFPSLRGQIKKALGRDDRVSVHHRLTEWLASYFDILFALNRSLHPGEKKLLAYSQNLPLLPEDHKTLVLALIEGAGRGDPHLLQDLDQLETQLDSILLKEGLALDP